MYKNLKFRPAAEWWFSPCSRGCGLQRGSVERMRSAITFVLYDRSMQRAQAGRRRLLRSHLKLGTLPRGFEKRHWPSIRRKTSRTSQS